MPCIARGLQSHAVGCSRRRASQQGGFRGDAVRRSKATWRGNVFPHQKPGQQQPLLAHIRARSMKFEDHFGMDGPLSAPGRALNSSTKQSTGVCCLRPKRSEKCALKQWSQHAPIWFPHCFFGREIRFHPAALLASSARFSARVPPSARSRPTPAASVTDLAPPCGRTHPPPRHGGRRRQAAFRSFASACFAWASVSAFTSAMTSFTCSWASANASLDCLASL